MQNIPDIKFENYTTELMEMESQPKNLVAYYNSRYAQDVSAAANKTEFIPWTGGYTRTDARLFFGCVSLVCEKHMSAGSYNNWCAWFNDTWGKLSGRVLTEFLTEHIAYLKKNADIPELSSERKQSGQKIS
jgi:hypothetical protein